jgi:hypothetical protein
MLRVASNALIVPPFECAWLSLGDYHLDGACCLQFECKGWYNGYCPRKPAAVGRVCSSKEAMAVTAADKTASALFLPTMHTDTATHCCDMLIVIVTPIIFYPIGRRE